MEFRVEERHCLALKSVTHPAGKALLSTAGFQGSEEMHSERGYRNLCAKLWTKLSISTYFKWVQMQLLDYSFNRDFHKDALFYKVNLQVIN